ncbi:hypothetical protein INR49_005773, partial [Caranx melampygus]
METESNQRINHEREEDLRAKARSLYVSRSSPPDSCPQAQQQDSGLARQNWGYVSGRPGVCRVSSLSSQAVSVSVSAALEPSSPPRPSATCTPPPDFSQCLAAPSSMTPMTSMASHPFNTRMALQQNS